MAHPSLFDFLAAAPAVRRRWLLRGSLIGGLVLLVSCGGGQIAGVGTGGTGSFASGPIGGLGSVIVNGVRYDDSQASVSDDEGRPGAAADLRVGMVVEVRGRIADDGQRGTAESFVVVAALRGPVRAVDAAGGWLTVFGQRVSVTPRTVFDGGAAGLAGLAPGEVVEVHALLDPAGVPVATRIERLAASVAAYSGDFRAVGPISALAGSGEVRRFTVAGISVSTSAATPIDGTLQDGATAVVRLGRLPAGDGSYAALRVQLREAAFDDGAEQAEVSGLVSGFAGVTQPLRVGGFPVRLASGAVFEGGVSSDLADGARVEVEGSVQGGVLVARVVKFEREDEDGGGDGASAPYEFEGVVVCIACRPSSGRFTVRGVEIVYDADTRFGDGATPAALDGARVHVRAVAAVGDRGTVFRATRIEIER